MNRAIQTFGGTALRVIFVLAVAAARLVSAAPTFTTLDVPGATNTEAIGIDGKNIVGSYTDSAGKMHGFLYNGASFTTLDAPFAVSTWATGISGNNVVGDYIDTSGTQHAFLYNAGAITALNAPPVANFTTYAAIGISNNLIVGTYKEEVNVGYSYPLTHGYTQNGNTYTTLDDPLAYTGDPFGANAITTFFDPIAYMGSDRPYVGTVALGVSGNNIVGGYYTVYSDANGTHAVTHGFLYNGSAYATLDYPAAADTFAHGISGNNVVGLYEDSSGGTHGFLYNGSSFTAVDEPQGVATEINGISGNVVVGDYEDANGGVHGFVSTLSAVLAVDADPPSGGAVSGGGTFPVDSQEQISETPASGYVFTSWNDGNTSPTRIVTALPGEVTYTANFQAEPTYNTLPPTNVGSLSATLNGTVNPNGTDTVVYFQWGKDTSYGNTTANQDQGSGTTTSNFSATVNVQSLDRIYHYRAVAVSAGKSYHGPDLTFTSGPSVVTLANISNLMYTSDTLGFGNYRTFLGASNQFPGIDTNNGFLGAAYSSADGTQVIIAFRGTDASTWFTLWKNVISDTSFLSSPPTPSLKFQQDATSAVKFVQFIEQKYLMPTVNLPTPPYFTLTGHSLGGALGQVIGQASQQDTAVFNAPGAGALYDQLGLPSSFPLPANPKPTNINYRIYGDQVSQAGTAMGTGRVTYAPPPVPNNGVITPAASPLLTFLTNLTPILNDHLYFISPLSGPQDTEPDEPNFIPEIQDIIKWVGIAFPSFEEELNFLFSLNDVLSVAIDPDVGTNFVFTETAGSPLLTSILLPALPGVQSYDVSYQLGGVWSAFQPAQVNTTFAFVTPVTGVNFIGLDVNGGQVTLPDFLFEATFASSGTVTASLTETTTSANNVASLSSLVLSGGVSLSPAFASGTTSYGASAPGSVTSISLTPTTSDPNATVTVNGAPIASGSLSEAINLNVGSTIITVVVTAQDGVTTQTYTVAVNAPIVVVKAGSASLTSGNSLIDFGLTASGSKTLKSFTIQNTGTANLSLSTLNIDGTNGADFLVTTSPVSPVIPTGSTTFNVTFTPQGLGLQTATLHIPSNDPNMSTFTVQLQGTGSLAATSPAISVSSGWATINGSANPNGAATTSYFEYGTTTNYGSSTATLNLGSGTTALPVSFNISGLTKGTTYHYQLVVDSGGTLYYGGDQTFTTPSTASPPAWHSAQITSLTNPSLNNMADGARTGAAHSSSELYFYKGTDSNMWCVYLKGGTTWTQVQLTTNTNVSDWLAFEPNYGALCYQSNDGNLWCVYYSTATAKWVTEQLGTPPQGVTVAGDIVVDSSGGWNNIYYRGSDSHLYAAYLKGSTWTHVSLGGTATVKGNLAVQGNNHLIYYQGTDNNIWCFYYTGKVWEQVQLSTTANVGGSVAVDSAGLLVYYKSSTDDSAWCTYPVGGTTWTPVQLDATANMSTSATSFSNIAPYNSAHYNTEYLDNNGQCDALFNNGSKWGHSLLGDGGFNLTGGLSLQPVYHWIFARRSDGNVVIFYNQ